MFLTCFFVLSNLTPKPRGSLAPCAICPGDFVFFSDPATLLHEHIRVTEMKPGTVATHPTLGRV